MTVVSFSLPISTDLKARSLLFHIPLPTKKVIYNLKVESYVLFSGEFLGFQCQEAASQENLRELLQGGKGREDLDYIGILKQMAGSRNKKIVVTYRKLEISSYRI